MCGLDYPCRYEFDARIWRCDGAATCLYNADKCVINQRGPMAFKPNYGRDRADRARAARARSEEKQQKKDEKTALRKAERAGAEQPTGEANPPPEEKQS
jgi:hypothetical protein